jgi:hypothetical protein
MKRFELVKRDDHYGLYNEDGHKIAATIDGCNSKLSKENCDEIFGVVDVGALALEECNNTDPLRLDSVKYKQDPYFRIGYLKGFNKAMELNKDKLFTTTNLRVGMINLLYLEKEKDELSDVFKERQFKFVDKFIQSLQQPKEIEVQIVTKPYTDVHEGFELEAKREPKLDADGNLILKRL